MRFGEAMEYFERVLETGCVDTDEEFLDAVETAIRALNFSEMFSTQPLGFALEFDSEYRCSKDSE